MCHAYFYLSGMLCPARSIDASYLPCQVQVAARALQATSYDAKRQGVLPCFLCAGWDSTSGGQVFTVLPGGSLVPATQGFAVAGSGSSIIHGW